MNNDSTRVFDLSYLNQIFQGNTAMINSIIEMFLKQVPEYVAEMETCVLLNDLNSLHPLAHKAKSSIAMLGLKRMESLVLKIESNSKLEMDVSQLPVLVGQVRTECDKVFTQLTYLINTSKVSS